VAQVNRIRFVQGGHKRFEDLRLPPRADAGITQDEEWCEVTIDGERRRIRFHDYAEIYEIPGLYEALFYEALECCSPRTVRSLLETELERADFDPTELVALDLGAGNGIVGEELLDLGARTIVGVDIVEAAAEAVERDRPDVYDEYLVADLTRLSPDEHERLSDRPFNCLTSVAALGFGDIPPQAFTAAYGLLEPGGWIGLTIKEDFLATEDPTGFQMLIRRMLEDGSLDLRAKRRYRHRLSSLGEPLHYVAMIATKAATRRPSRRAGAAAGTGVGA